MLQFRDYGIMQKKTRKQYSVEFKAKVVREMLREEKAVAQLAAEYGVRSNKLYCWRDQSLARLPNLSSFCKFDI